MTRLTITMSLWYNYESKPSEQHRIFIVLTSSISSILKPIFLEKEKGNDLRWREHIHSEKITIRLSQIRWFGGRYLVYSFSEKTTLIFGSSLWIFLPGRYSMTFKLSSPSHSFSRFVHSPHLVPWSHPPTIHYYQSQHPPSVTTSWPSDVFLCVSAFVILL